MEGAVLRVTPVPTHGRRPRMSVCRARIRIRGAREDAVVAVDAVHAANAPLRHYFEAGAEPSLHPALRPEVPPS